MTINFNAQEFHAQLKETAQQMMVGTLQVTIVASAIGIALSALGVNAVASTPLNQLKGDDAVVRDLSRTFGAVLVNQAVANVGKDNVLTLATEVERLVKADMYAKYGTLATDSALLAAPPGDIKYAQILAQTLASKGYGNTASAQDVPPAVVVASQKTTQVASDKNAKTVLDTVTGIVYSSHNFAGRGVALAEPGLRTKNGAVLDPYDSHVWFAILSIYPARFKDVNMPVTAPNLGKVRATSGTHNSALTTTALKSSISNAQQPVGAPETIKALGWQDRAPEPGELTLGMSDAQASYIATKLRRIYINSWPKPSASILKAYAERFARKDLWLNLIDSESSKVAAMAMMSQDKWTTAKVTTTSDAQQKVETEQAVASQIITNYGADSIPLSQALSEMGDAQPKITITFAEKQKMVSIALPEWGYVIKELSQGQPGGKMKHPRKFVEVIKIIPTPAKFNPSHIDDYSYSESFAWDGKHLSKGESYSYDSMINVVGGVFEREVTVPKGVRIWICIYSGAQGGHWVSVNVYASPEDIIASKGLYDIGNSKLEVT